MTATEKAAEAADEMQVEKSQDSILKGKLDRINRIKDRWVGQSLASCLAGPWM